MARRKTGFLSNLVKAPEHKAETPNGVAYAEGEGLNQDRFGKYNPRTGTFTEPKKWGGNRTGE